MILEQITAEESESNDILGGPESLKDGLSKIQKDLVHGLPERQAILSREAVKLITEGITVRNFADRFIYALRSDVQRLLTDEGKEKVMFDVYLALVHGAQARPADWDEVLGMVSSGEESGYLSDQQAEALRMTLIRHAELDAIDESLDAALDGLHKAEISGNLSHNQAQEVSNMYIRSCLDTTDNARLIHVLSEVVKRYGFGGQTPELHDLFKEKIEAIAETLTMDDDMHDFLFILWCRHTPSETEALCVKIIERFFGAASLDSLPTVASRLQEMKGIGIFTEDKVRECAIAGFKRFVQSAELNNAQTIFMTLYESQSRCPDNYNPKNGFYNLWNEIGTRVLEKVALRIGHQDVNLFYAIAIRAAVPLVRLEQVHRVFQPILSRLIDEADTDSIAGIMDLFDRVGNAMSSLMIPGESEGLKARALSGMFTQKGVDLPRLRSQLGALVPMYRAYMTIPSYGPSQQIQEILHFIADNIHKQLILSINGSSVPLILKGLRSYESSIFSPDQKKGLVDALEDACKAMRDPATVQEVVNSMASAKIVDKLSLFDGDTARVQRLVYDMISRLIESQGEFDSVSAIFNTARENDLLSAESGVTLDTRLKSTPMQV